MSMARVHREFIRLAANSQSFGKKVSDLGHFEFGPNRKVITVNPEGCKLTETYWAQGDDYRGYLQQWIDVYSFVLRNYLNKDVMRRQLLLVDYGRFITDTKSEINRIADFCQLQTTSAFLLHAVGKVKTTSGYVTPCKYNDKENLARKVYTDVLSSYAGANSYVCDIA